MALIVMGGLKDNELSDIRAAAAELSPVWAARLSVFWSDPDFVVGRFPPLDLIDYLDHAVTLVERQRSTPPRPTLDEIRTYLAGAPFAGWLASARQFAEKSELGSNEHKNYLRTLLYPARFIMSWRTGRIASNDEAVAFLRNAVPTGLDIDIVERALECRRRAEDPIGLWQDRNILPQHIDVCQRLANENVTRGCVARTQCGIEWTQPFPVMAHRVASLRRTDSVAIEGIHSAKPCCPSGRREGPNSDISEPSFDHLVGAIKHGVRHCKAERLRGLEIDHQLVFGRRPHRKVGRLVALEDSVDVAARERIGTPINFHVFISRLV